MKANKQFSTGVIKFTFTDEDGEVFSSFKMNPTDVKLMSRAEEVAAYFEKRQNEEMNIETGEELVRYNNEIEEKINYLLGYDASNEIFGEITATTISPDGDIFAFVVLDFIMEKLKPEMEKRRKNMQKAINKYTEKYTK